MKRLALLLCLMAVFPVLIPAQSARTEIMQHPKLAAGKYYAYEPPCTPITPPPAGYKPFYISAFARHGSRYLTKEAYYTVPLHALSRAERDGVLSADGRRALYVIEQLAREAEGRYGELTPKGARQHRGLVDRMFAHYPQVFADGAHIDARSTTKSRALLSMAAACIELKGLNPKLCITADASEHDASFMKYKNEAFASLHLSRSQTVMRTADSVYLHPRRLMRQLFTDTAYVHRHFADGIRLMAGLFELDGISQSSDTLPDLHFLFTPEERYDLWQRNNFEWYYEKGPSPLSDSCMYRIERNLLRNFVEAADTAIAAGHPAACLRYGHDTNLAPLAVLMGLDSLATATTDWQRVGDTYRTYRIIPMCGNIQLIFYRRPGSHDILVKPLLNEREATLPVHTDLSPFYHWSDVRRYWLRLIADIHLP